MNARATIATLAVIGAPKAFAIFLASASDQAAITDYLAEHYGKR